MFGIRGCFKYPAGEDANSRGEVAPGRRAGQGPGQQGRIPSAANTMWPLHSLGPIGKGGEEWHSPSRDPQTPAAGFGACIS